MANAPAFQDMVKFETNFLVPVYVSVTQTCPRSVIDFLVTPSNYSKKKKKHCWYIKSNTISPLSFKIGIANCSTKGCEKLS